MGTRRLKGPNAFGALFRRPFGKKNEWSGQFEFTNGFCCYGTGIATSNQPRRASVRFRSVRDSLASGCCAVRDGAKSGLAPSG